MDQMEKTSIASVLVREPKESRKRLVLGLTSPTSKVAELGNASFKDRTEYRKALVEHQRRTQQAYVDGLATKLCRHGLTVHAYPLTNTIVVEGGARQLAFALDDERVATAAFDEQLPLIEPIDN